MSSRRHAVAILMYHKVGEPEYGGSHRFLNVGQAAFRRQIRLVRRLHFTALSVTDLAGRLRSGRPLPPRAVCVTFDDGYECVYHAAAPALRDAGFPAAVYVVSGCVGAENRWDSPMGHPASALMSWAQLRRLVESGWEVGSHTLSHADLAVLADEAATEEMAAGKSAAEEMLGRRVESFCYPFGRRNSRSAALVRACGFTSACSTQSGLVRAGTDPLLLPRVKVRSDSLPDFLFRLLVRPRFSSPDRGLRAPIERLP